MNEKEFIGSYKELEKARKKHSLKTVNTLQIEEAIAKALTELLGWGHEVEISTIVFTNLEVEISLKTKQDTFNEDKYRIV